MLTRRKPGSSSDVDNFWRAFDLAQKEADKEKKIAIYQTEYLDKGSVGLKDFVRLRIKDAKDLSQTIENLPKFYASIRPSKDRPGDLGYYMGYKISWSYYKNAKNKKQAIRDVLNVKDFPAFFEKSLYREKFAD